MAAYASASDMIKRFDEEVLKQLVRDQGTPATSLTSNTNVTMALDTATGRIKSALLRGKRYTADDLDDLTDESLEFLKDITCRVAFWVLWQRKPYLAAQDPTSDLAHEQSEYWLKLLKTGEEIFAIDTHIAAGLPDASSVAPETVRTKWGLAVDQCRPRFYPKRRTYG